MTTKAIERMLKRYVENPNVVGLSFKIGKYSFGVGKTSNECIAEKISLDKDESAMTCSFRRKTDDAVEDTSFVVDAESVEIIVEYTVGSPCDSKSVVEIK